MIPFSVQATEPVTYFPVRTVEVESRICILIPTDLFGTVGSPLNASPRCVYEISDWRRLPPSRADTPAPSNTGIPRPNTCDVRADVIGENGAQNAHVLSRPD